MEILQTTQWGGTGISINLDEEAQPAQLIVAFDCAHGAIEHPIKLDSAGNFSASGTFTPEHGGPIRIDEPDRTQTAIYKGQVTGTKMTLSIELGGKAPMPGPFELKANSSGRIFKCL